MRRTFAVAGLALMVLCARPAGGEGEIHWARPKSHQVAELVQRGDDAFRDGRFIVARDYYQRALKLLPEHAPALLGVANSYFEMGRYPDALHWAEKSARAEPTAGAHLIIGHSAWRVGQLDKALAAYRTLQRQFPGTPGIDSYISRVQELIEKERTKARRADGGPPC
jgi:tetratricopeptide (TPR) repeat protein